MNAKISALPLLIFFSFVGCSSSDLNDVASKPAEPSSSLPSSFALKPVNQISSKLILNDVLIDLPASPGYQVINGSVASFRDTFYVAYRMEPIIPRPSGCGQQLVIAELTPSFKVTGNPQVLDTTGDPSICSTAEDPRLLSHEGKLYLVYNSTADGQVFNVNRDIYLAELDIGVDADETKEISIKKRKLLLMADGQRNFTEKNWTPFSCDKSLHFVYETNPPYVAVLSQEEWDSATSVAYIRTVSKLSAKVAEPFGSMRGGSPALFVPNIGYLSFFHTFMLVGGGPSDPYSALYMAGAYAFEDEPPFAIKRIMTFPLVPATAYDDLNLLTEDRQKFGWITYPQGLIVDGEYAYMSYSQNDRRLRMMTLNLEALRYFLLRPSPENTIKR